MRASEMPQHTSDATTCVRRRRPCVADPSYCAATGEHCVATSHAELAAAHRPTQRPRAAQRRAGSTSARRRSVPHAPRAACRPLHAACRLPLRVGFRLLLRSTCASARVHTCPTTHITLLSETSMPRSADGAVSAMYMGTYVSSCPKWAHPVPVKLAVSAPSLRPSPLSPPLLRRLPLSPRPRFPVPSPRCASAPADRAPVRPLEQIGRPGVLKRAFPALLHAARRGRGYGVRGHADGDSDDDSPEDELPQALRDCHHSCTHAEINVRPEGRARRNESARRRRNWPGQCSPVPVQTWPMQPIPGADVAGVSPVPVQTRAGVSPVPVQTWQGTSRTSAAWRGARLLEGYPMHYGYPIPS